MQPKHDRLQSYCHMCIRLKLANILIRTTRVGVPPTGRRFKSQLTKGLHSLALVINWGWGENIPGLRFPTFCPLPGSSQCQLIQASTSLPFPFPFTFFITLTVDQPQLETRHETDDYQHYLYCIHISILWCPPAAAERSPSLLTDPVWFLSIQISPSSISTFNVLTRFLEASQVTTLILFHRLLTVLSKSKIITWALV